MYAQKASSEGSYTTPEGVTVLGAYKPEFESILTEDALSFVASLARKYSSRYVEWFPGGSSIWLPCL